MKKIALLLVSGWVLSAEAQFIHPGVCHTQADLDRMKTNVAAGTSPWVDGFEVLRNDSHSSSGYTPHPVTVVSNAPGVAHYFNIEDDSTAAYQNALMWNATGNTANRDKAISIINGWSYALTNFIGANISAGFCVYKFAAAADILKYENSGWSAADFSKCISMLEIIYTNSVYNPSQGLPLSNGNQGILDICAIMALGILEDNTNKYNYGVSLYTGTTNYNYSAITNFTTVPAPGSYNSALPCLVITCAIDANGCPGESGRDQAHGDYPAFYEQDAAIAWCQGLDLYSFANNRLLAGAEWYAAYNMGNYAIWSNPSTCPCGNFNNWPGLSDLNRGTWSPKHENIYGHYVSLKGLAAPYSAGWVHINRPEGNDSVDEQGYGTLLYSLQPSLPGPFNGGPYKITAVNSGLALGVVGGSASTGAQIEQRAYSGGASQQWTFTSRSGDYIQAVNGNSGLTLNCGNSVGNLISQQNWSASRLQMLYLVDAGGGKFNVVSQDQLSNKLPFRFYLWHVVGNSIANGALIEMQEDAGGVTTGNSIGLNTTDTSPVPSPQSSQQFIITLDGASTLPSVPTNLVAQAGGGQVTIGWRGIGATGFYVKRSTISGGPYTIIASNIVTTLYTDTNLTVGASYVYVVSANNLTGQSADSIQVSATPFAKPVPWTPINLKAGRGDAQARLLWWTSPNADSYNVKRSTVSGGSYTTITNITGTSLIDTGLANGVTYYYVISAVNSTGQSGNSIEVSVAPSANRAVGGLASPYAPGGTVQENCLSAFDGQTGTKYLGPTPPMTVGYHFAYGLAWAVNRYDVSSANDVPQRDPKDWQFQGSHDGVSWTTLDTRSSQTFSSRFQAIQYSFSNTNAYEYYQLNVTANSGGTNYGTQLSELAFYSAAVPPTAPVDLTATPSNSIVTLNWIASAGATSYIVKSSTTNGGPYSIVESNLTSLTYTDTGLANGTAYYYVVAVVNGSGTSSNSAQASATPVGTPATPTGLAAVATITGATLNWNASATAASYNLKRSTSSGGSYITVANITSTNYADTGLTASTTYYYVVSAVNVSGESADSAQVSVTATPSPLIWTGAINTNWDINTTANWSSNSVAKSFLNGSSVQFDDSTSSNVVNVAASVSPAYLLLNNSTKTYTFSSSAGFGIGGTGYIVKNGGGSAAFNIANSYSGGTVVNNGTITIGNGAALGTSTVTLAGGALRTTATVTVNNNIAAQAGTTSTLDTSANLTLNGNLSGSGNITRGTSGTFTVYLFGDDSGFSGTFTSVNNGNSVVRFANANAGSAAAAWAFNNGTSQRQTLESSLGSPIQFGSFTGTGDFRNNGTYNNTIQVGALGLNDTFTGTLGASGTLSLTKVGVGTMRLIGSNPGLNGVVTALGGELIVYPAYTGKASFVVTNGGTLGFTNQFTATSLAISNLTLNAGGVLEFQSVSNLAVPLVTASNMTITGSCVVEITGTNNLTIGNIYPLINYSGSFNGNFANFHLQTTNGMGGVLVSNSQQIALSVVAAPLPPTNLTAIAGDSQATLNWNSSANATGYNVKRATDINGDYASIMTVGTTNYTDVSVDNGTVYYYVVSTLYSGGETANSAPVSAMPQVPPPATPTSLTATAGDAQVGLLWSASSGATGYNVKNSSINSGPYAIVASSVSGLAFTNGGLANGTLYYFVVTATNAGGESADSTQVSARPVSPVSTNLAFGVSSGQLQLTWPQDHTGWTLQVQTNSLGIGLSTNWVDMSNSIFNNQLIVPLDPTNGSVFFRLKYP